MRTSRDGEAEARPEESRADDLNAFKLGTVMLKASAHNTLVLFMERKRTSN